MSAKESSRDGTIPRTKARHDKKNNKKTSRGRNKTLIARHFGRPQEAEEYINVEDNDGDDLQTIVLVMPRRLSI